MKNLSLKHNKIIIIGFGTIGRAVLPLLLKHIEINSNQIEIISSNYLNLEFAEKENVKFNCFELTPDNFEKYLAPKLSPGDLLLNLSVGVSCLDLIKLCHNLDVLYLDTSNETWPSQTANNEPLTTFDRREKLLSYKNQFNKGPTALICHGANPGLVTHFTKQALLDIANGSCSQHVSYNDEGWGLLAKQNSIRAIHISERDTQFSNMPRQLNEYINTWSIEGFLEESAENAVFAWGSHEEEIPDHFIKRRLATNKVNMIELNKAGALIKMISWVPSFGSFHGFLIPHPEAFSIAELFSYKDETGFIYHPTVHFVYQPCNDALLSMHDSLVQTNKDFKKRLLFDDIIGGMDELGALILREDTSDVYWYGSRLDIDQARNLSPNNNATSLQVAAGVLAGIIWIYENPNLGLVEPEQVDFKRALDIASPYLGICEGYSADWEHHRSSDYLANPYKWKFSELSVNLI